MVYENYFHELLVYKYGPFPSYSVPFLKTLVRYEKESKKYNNLMENPFVLRYDPGINNFCNSDIIEILEITYPGEIDINNNVKIYKSDRKNFRIFNFDGIKNLLIKI